MTALQLYIYSKLLPTDITQELVLMSQAPNLTERLIDFISSYDFPDNHMLDTLQHDVDELESSLDRWRSRALKSQEENTLLKKEIQILQEKIKFLERD